jgi:DNA-directed RNA polymerase subunit RPC12/RpoP
MQKMIEVKFKCAQCGAEDSPKFFPNEAIPPAVNCWKCHAGYNKPIEEMLALKMGMFHQARA